MKNIWDKSLKTQIVVTICLSLGILGYDLNAGYSAFASELKSSDSQIFELGEVVVTAESERKESPGSVTVITAEDIKRYNASNLGEAFRVIPGMVFRQARTKNEHYVTVRGFDQENVQILLDGVPIYVPYEGLVNLADIPVQNIAEIRVIKGNASVLYGANAMGGVINVITKKGTEKPSLSANYQISDYNTHHIQATHGWKIGNFSYFLGASHKESDGFKLAERFSLPADVVNSMAVAPTKPAAPKNTPIASDDGRRENSDYDRNALTFTGNLDITPDDKAGLSLEYYKHEYGVTPVTIYREAGNGKFYYYPRYWQFSDWKRYTANLIEESKISEHFRIKGRLFYDAYKSNLDAYDDNTYSTQNRIGGPPSGDSIYDDYSTGGNLYTFWEGMPRNNIRLGFSFKKDVHRSYSDAQGVRSKEFMSSYTYSVGLEDEIKILDTLLMTAGCSYDTFEKREREQTAGGPLGDNIHVFSPSVGLRYDYSPTLDFYGSAAKKIRFPTMRNLFADGIIGPKGDPNLKEERSYNYEVGSSWSFAEKFMLDSAVFYNDIKNLINFDNQIGRFEQYKKAYIAGAELSLSSQLTNQLYGKVSYTYLRARANSDVTLSNNVAPSLVYSPDELPYRPEHKIDLELRQKFSFGTTLDLNGSFISKRTFYDHADAVNNTLVAKKDHLASYVIANFKISQDLGHGICAYISAENLFNKDYQDIYQLPASGRTVWAGIKLDI